MEDYGYLSSSKILMDRMELMVEWLLKEIMFLVQYQDTFPQSRCSIIPT